jgi:quinol monooxygenase YgiN
MYYGTVAKYRLKPGHEEQLMGVMKGFEQSPPAGWMYTTFFRSAEDPSDIWMSVAFESEEAYRKNADSPEMDRQYRAMLEHLQGEPEWHDGHVIHEARRKG